MPAPPAPAGVVPLNRTNNGIETWSVFTIVVIALRLLIAPIMELKLINIIITINIIFTLNRTNNGIETPRPANEKQAR